MYAAPGVRIDPGRCTRVTASLAAAGLDLTSSLHLEQPVHVFQALAFEVTHQEFHLARPARDARLGRPPAVGPADQAARAVW